MITAKTLVLDTSYQPLGTVSWQKAFLLLIKEYVEVVEEYADVVVHSAKQTWKVPAVIRFVKKVFRKNRKMKFSRKNIYLRDRGECQYCAKPVARDDFTWDHVLPRSKGGKSEWENLVLCCIKCNQKKGDKTPEEAGLKLIRKPQTPSTCLGVIQFLSKDDTPTEWGSYLYWNTALDQT